ncbi:MAG: hypothetical protein WAM90_12925, partial [Rhodanobacter sp.]
AGSRLNCYLCPGTSVTYLLGLYTTQEKSDSPSAGGRNALKALMQPKQQNSKTAKQQNSG